MPLEEIINNARDNAIRESYAKLSQTEEWAKHGKMGHLYMMCLDLQYSHVKLYPRLQNLGLEL